MGRGSSASTKFLAGQAGLAVRRGVGRRQERLDGGEERREQAVLVGVGDQPPVLGLEGGAAVVAFEPLAQGLEPARRQGGQRAVLYIGGGLRADLGLTEVAGLGVERLEGRFEGTRLGSRRRSFWWRATACFENSAPPWT